MKAPKKKTMAKKINLPKNFLDFVAKFPVLAKAHETVGREVERLGPLDRKTCELIKVGICLGAGLETATKSHVRRAVEHGASVEEIDQTILLGMNTCGFPATAAAWKWSREQLERGSAELAET